MFSSLWTNMNEYVRPYGRIHVYLFIGTNFLKRNGMMKWPCVSKLLYLGMNRPQFSSLGTNVYSSLCANYVIYLCCAVLNNYRTYTCILTACVTWSSVYFENTPFYALWNSRASTKWTWCILGQFRKNCWPPTFVYLGDMKFTKINLYKLQFTLIFFIKFYCKAMHIFSRLLLYQHRQYTHQYNLYET